MQLMVEMANQYFDNTLICRILYLGKITCGLG